MVLVPRGGGARAQAGFSENANAPLVRNPEESGGLWIAQTLKINRTLSASSGVRVRV